MLGGGGGGATKWPVSITMTGAMKDKPWKYKERNIGRQQIRIIYQRNTIESIKSRESKQKKC